MMALQFKLFGLVAFLSPVIAYGQLRPDDFVPTNVQSVSKFEELIELRDTLEFTPDVEELSKTVEEIDAIRALANQLRSEEGESSTGKRYGLLVEGFDRLRLTVDRISFLIERKEYSLAADTIDEVELMNRLWHGHPDRALQEWANQFRGLSSDQEKPLQALNEKISQEWLSKNLDEARASLKLLLKRQREIYGESHSEVLETLIALWEIHFESGLASESREFLDDAVEISNEVYGEAHWSSLKFQENLNTVDALLDSPLDVQKRVFQLWTNSLDLSDITDENVDKILALADREIGVAEQALGFNSSLVAFAYIQFANLALKLDRLNYAVAFYLRGVSTAQKTYGDVHPITCSALENWSMACHRLNDNERAFNLATQTVHMNRKLYGEGSKAYRKSLAYNGFLFYRFERYPQARQVLEKVKRIYLLTGDDNSVEFANARVHLGQVYFRLGEYEKSNEEYVSAIKILKEEDRGYIEALGGSVSIYIAQREYANALELQSDVVNLARKHYGADDIRYAYALENLASLQEFTGQFRDAIGTLEQSLSVTRNHLDNLGKLQGNRLRINAYTNERTALFHYLTIASELGDMDTRAYEKVSTWKAAVIRQGRILAQAKDVNSEILFDQKMQTIADMISNSLTVVDTRANDSIEIERLNELIQAWEDVHRNVVVQDELTYGKSSIDDLKKELPRETVLVDFFQYNHMTPNRDRAEDMFDVESRMLAFVIRKDRPVKMISLGTVSEVEDIVSRWRHEISRQIGGARVLKSPLNAADQKFFELIWKPISKLTGDPKHIIICPDGMLCLAPWPAIPVTPKRRYLVEDASVSILPYAEFAMQMRKSLDSKEPPAMTLVGNLDFDQPVQGESEGRIFNKLPGTARELVAIESLFDQTYPKGRLSNLEMRNGTEANVRLRAMRSNYLHVATHGFFAPDIWQSHRVSDEKTAFRQRVRVMVPEALSALVLSGANRGLESSEVFAAKSFGEDGVLTGLEVISMDLRNLDLVTLSACETSVGTVAPGIGKLGLEQSFLAAGANSVVSSLWQVDDAATAMLMVEFYRNLWSGKMSKAEAMRQAQLTLLNRYDLETNDLLPRGLKLVDKPGTSKADGRLPPYYWAPFVISGDWR